MSVIKFNSVSEGIALRLNQLAGNLSPLGLAFDITTGSVRVVLPNNNVTAFNQVLIGGINASGMVIDSTNTAWASSVRGRIT